MHIAHFIPIGPTVGGGYMLKVSLVTLFVQIINCFFLFYLVDKRCDHCNNNSKTLIFSDNIQLNSLNYPSSKIYQTINKKTIGKNQGLNFLKSNSSIYSGMPKSERVQILDRWLLIGSNKVVYQNSFGLFKTIHACITNKVRKPN